MNDSADLSLVSTDDLISELLKRQDATVIVRLIKPRPGKSLSPTIDYAGGLVTAVGLADYAHTALMDELISPDDE